MPPLRILEFNLGFCGNTRHRALKCNVSLLMAESLFVFTQKFLHRFNPIALKNMKIIWVFQGLKNCVGPRCHVILAILQMSISYILDRVLLLGQIVRFKNSVFQKDRESSNTCLWNNLINFENPMSKEFSILPSQIFCSQEKKKKIIMKISEFLQIL